MTTSLDKSGGSNHPNASVVYKFIYSHPAGRELWAKFVECKSRKAKDRPQTLQELRASLALQLKNAQALENVRSQAYSRRVRILPGIRENDPIIMMESVLLPDEVKNPRGALGVNRAVTPKTESTHQNIDRPSKATRPASDLGTETISARDAPTIAVPEISSIEESISTALKSSLKRK